MAWMLFRLGHNAVPPLAHRRPAAAMLLDAATALTSTTTPPASRQAHASDADTSRRQPAGVTGAGA